MDKVTPHDENKEKSVIASIILIEGDRDKAFKLLSPDDFYFESNKIIFRKCQELTNRGEPIEAGIIAAELDDEEKKYVQPQLLSKLIDEPVSPDIEYHTKILKDLSHKRRAIELGNAIIKRAHDSDIDKIQWLANQLLVETKEPTAKAEKIQSSAFPYQVMTGAAGYFTNCYSQILEVPEPFLFIGYLTCLGAVLSNRLKIKSELNTQARLYAMLVGESALERKSTALNKLTEHFRSVVNNFSICWGVGSAEGLQKLLKKNQDEKIPGLILVFDELKSFVSKCKIDSSILLPCVNTLFESNRYHSHTKKISIEIDDAHLSLLGASTLHTYERIYNGAFVDIGFPNRVFLVVGTANRRYSIPEKISQKDIDVMESNLVKVLKHVGDGLELDIEADAREFYHDWYMNLEQSIHARRLDTYSLRLTMLLAANNLKHSIDLETVEHATTLCDWQLEVRKMHDPIDADSTMAKMEERIRRHLKIQPLKDYELKRKTGANRAGLWVYDNALKNLRRSGEIGWDKRNRQWFYIEN